MSLCRLDVARASGVELTCPGSLPCAAAKLRMVALRHHRRRQDHIARLGKAWEAGEAVFGKDRIRPVLARPRIVPTQKDAEVIKARATAAMKAIDNRCKATQRLGHRGKTKYNDLLLKDLIDSLLKRCAQRPLPSPHLVSLLTRHLPPPSPFPLHTRLSRFDGPDLADMPAIVVDVTGADFHSTWASVDRVDSQGDYTVNNIRWMHCGLNSFKNESLDYHSNSVAGPSSRLKQSTLFGVFSR